MASRHGDGAVWDWVGCHRPGASEGKKKVTRSVRTERQSGDRLVRSRSRSRPAGAGTKARAQRQDPIQPGQISKRTISPDPISLSLGPVPAPPPIPNHLLSSLSTIPSITFHPTLPTLPTVPTPDSRPLLGPHDGHSLTAHLPTRSFSSTRFSSSSRRHLKPRSLTPTSSPAHQLASSPARPPCPPSDSARRPPPLSRSRTSSSAKQRRRRSQRDKSECNAALRGDTSIASFIC